MNKKAETDWAVPQPVTVYRNGNFIQEERLLVKEMMLSVFLNNRVVGRMICSPWSLEEAGVGLLFLKGLLYKREHITEIQLTPDHNEIFITATEKRLPPFTPKRLSVPASTITALARQLEDNSHLYHKTGGVHCAALARDNTFFAYQEDIDRHAAVNKLAGDCILRDKPLEGSIFVFSGRLQSIIVKNTATLGCSIMIARGAPTKQACQTAHDRQITLIGFARDKSFTIYTHPEQILL